MSESKKTELKRFNMNMPEDLHAYLKGVATELNVSLTSLVTHALEEYRKQRVMAYSMEEMLNMAKRQEALNEVDSKQQKNEEMKP
ncbi:hypothetical protein BLD48_12805 [Exiguobacterium sp. KRL4]|uniref:hypothetical protein n=1 Tax=Exiguobacterium sp. KRL4 TaxID=1914536 RepID=UPI0008F7F01B|nr:hypothetical protein [Exiguobacterium sp. KRL4]OIN66050.1 hypothetical protein BLD48_12805 [Exiguobacterium sp. KRL4]